MNTSACPLCRKPRDRHWPVQEADLTRKPQRSGPLRSTRERGPRVKCRWAKLRTTAPAAHRSMPVLRCLPSWRLRTRPLRRRGYGRGQRRQVIGARPFTNRLVFPGALVVVCGQTWLCGHPAGGFDVRRHGLVECVSFSSMRSMEYSLPPAPHRPRWCGTPARSRAVDRGESDVVIAGADYSGLSSRSRTASSRTQLACACLARGGASAEMPSPQDVHYVIADLFKAMIRGHRQGAGDELLIRRPIFCSAAGVPPAASRRSGRRRATRRRRRTGRSEMSPREPGETRQAAGTPRARRDCCLSGHEGDQCLRDHCRFGVEVVHLRPTRYPESPRSGLM